MAAALAVVSVAALAQGTTDPVERLRACSQKEGAARLECLDQLSRDMASPPSVAAQAPTPPATAPSSSSATPVADTWVVTETTSPLDYSPIAIATATSVVGSDGTVMTLSIQCRGGRTDIVVGGGGVPRGGEDAAITYKTNGGPAVTVGVAPAPSGVGLAFRTDTVRLVGSLPAEGEIAVRVSGRQGGGVEGRFSLAGLKSARDRIATTCKWPRN